MEQVDKEFLVEEIRMHIEEHEDKVMEHIEHHFTHHMGGLSSVIVDYERYSRKRGWIMAGFMGILATTNIILIALMLGGAEWIGTF